MFRKVCLFVSVGIGSDGRIVVENLLMDYLRKETNSRDVIQKVGDARVSRVLGIIRQMGRSFSQVATGDLK
jgi:hypothetical protein